MSLTYIVLPCNVGDMKKKPDDKRGSVSLPYTKSQAVKTIIELKDATRALEYGTLPADQQANIAISNSIIARLESTYPHIAPGVILSRLAIDDLERKYSLDDPDLQVWLDSEQEGLDDMWNYLEKREKE